MARLRPPVAVFVALLGLIGGAVLTGCAGGDTYSADVSDLADRYLPTTRQVDYHPDSLGALSIREKENRFQIELAVGYEGLHRRWSSSYQNLGMGRSQRTRSYATLWSKELSLASLEAETGVSGLTQKRARKLLAERRQEYQKVVQIDIYWFESEGNTLLAGPGSRIRLQIDGNTYRPAREDHGPLREAFLIGDSQGVLYRRNSFYFTRIVDGTDILEDTEKMTLMVDRSDAQSRVRFAWEWPAQ
ncbi:MAG: hypothetical protein ABEL97_05345 [Salinibacter sp.]